MRRTWSLLAVFVAPILAPGCGDDAVASTLDESERAVCAQVVRLVEVMDTRDGVVLRDALSELDRLATGPGSGEVTLLARELSASLNEPVDVEQMTVDEVSRMANRDLGISASALAELMSACNAGGVPVTWVPKGP
jgi:hypothetical protein